MNYMFYILAAFAIISALLMITRRNPIIAALYLIVNFFCLAGLYLTLQAQFIAVIQILVYAGAIMVLFVFVIMLLNLVEERKLKDSLSWKKIIAGGLSFGVLMELIYIFIGQTEPQSIELTRAANVGTVEAIGNIVFTRFLFPFEVTSLLLTAAIVGAVVLAKKNLN